MMGSLRKRHRPEEVVAKLGLADEALINGTPPSTCFSDARSKPLPSTPSFISHANVHVVVPGIAHVPCHQHAGQICSQDAAESR